MSTFIEKLEKIGSQILDEVEKKPIRSIIISVIVIWLVGKVIKSLK